MTVASLESLSNHIHKNCCDQFRLYRKELFWYRSKYWW